MNSEARAITDSCKTPKVKMIAAYETIKKMMKWNEIEFLYSKTDIKFSLNKGSGNAEKLILPYYYYLENWI